MRAGKAKGAASCLDAAHCLEFESIKEENETGNKTPQKVRFWTKGWEDVSDVMSDGRFMVWVGLGEGEGG